MAEESRIGSTLCNYGVISNYISNSRHIFVEKLVRYTMHPKASPARKKLNLS